MQIEFPVNYRVALDFTHSANLKIVILLNVF